VADLLFRRCRIWTADPANPRAQAMLVRRGRIVFVGDDADAPPAPGVAVVEGATVFPAFVDAHVHLLALASRLLGVEVAPPAVASMSALLERLRRKGETTPPGQWVRGWGYDESVLGGHPTRHHLDAVVPLHPVRLVHRSGHASVLNSLALRLVGITRETDDPPYGLIERDQEGEPTGLLLGLEGWLDRRIPPLSPQEVEEGLRRVNALLLSKGIALVHDATATNDLDRYRTLARARERGVLTVGVVFLPGIASLEAFVREGLRPGPAGDLIIGQAKVLLTPSLDGRLPTEVVEQARGAVEAGWAVAIHAVEEEAVALAAEAVRRAGPPPGPQPHRIEHASECPPPVVARVREAGAWVVSNPLFLYHSGPRYRAQVEPPLLPHLYPLGSLWRAGVPLAFGSDAPVTLPDPLLGIAAALSRRGYDGVPLAPWEGLPMEAALRAHTVGGWEVVGLQGGVLRPGMPAAVAWVEGEWEGDMPPPPSLSLLLPEEGAWRSWSSGGAATAPTTPGSSSRRAGRGG
jgi:predicted amidohydrolase YtcJ